MSYIWSNIFLEPEPKFHIESKISKLLDCTVLRRSNSSQYLVRHWYNRIIPN